MAKTRQESKSGESQRDWTNRMLERIKGWYPVFNLDLGASAWRDDLAHWESTIGRQRTETALTEAHYRAQDFNHFTAALVIACTPTAEGRKEPKRNCTLCDGQGWMKSPSDSSRVVKCDCLTGRVTVRDFKERQVGE